MSKLKSQATTAKIKKTVLEQIKRGANCEQFPAFSFQHMTTNQKYNFDYFSKKMSHDEQKAKSALINKLIEISSNTWLDISGQGKKMGFETIPQSEINFSPENYTMSKDSKYFIFQFNNHNMRIIGIKKDSCPIYYIIGFDFNFSAYNHGN
jgi:uncharacterized protein YuzE